MAKERQPQPEPVPAVPAEREADEEERREWSPPELEELPPFEDLELRS